MKLYIELCSCNNFLHSFFTVCIFLLSLIHHFVARLIVFKWTMQSQVAPHWLRDLTQKSQLPLKAPHKVIYDSSYHIYEPVLSFL